MLARIALGIIGAIYLAFAGWCALQPEKTSRSIGLQRASGSGESEYLTVYGGLQLGLGLMFLLPLWRLELTGPVLLSCLVIHAALVGTRLLSLLLYSGVSSLTLSLAAGELALLLVTVWLQWQHRGSSVPIS